MKKIALSEEGIETVYGARDANLKHIESLLNVEIRTQGGEVTIEGEPKNELRAQQIFKQLQELRDEGYPLSNGDVKTAAQLLVENADLDLRDYFLRGGQKQVTRRRVTPKSVNQRRYLDSIEQFDIVFGVGPAGTGKTYLAMAQAVTYLLEKKVSRIILARPAVEAGEKLGFLPGDIAEKVNPYLRPLYDALYDMVDYEKASAFIERGTVEVAPLAFMRGRTLNDSFIILDEAQNTTSEQMKMFLTRLGYNSKAVITGDVTQVDLAPGKVSGLVEVQDVLRGIEGIRFVYFTERDVVRHELVQQIIRAYETFQPRAEHRGDGHGGGTQSDGTG